MAEYDDLHDADWPPGTIQLAQLLGTDKKDGEIILQPRPTSDPNDPLVSEQLCDVEALEADAMCRTGRKDRRY